VLFIYWFFSISEETKMKKYACTFLAASLLTISAPAFAQSGAVNINIGSIGGPLDVIAHGGGQVAKMDWPARAREMA
jgi:hypothetical protein